MIKDSISAEYYGLLKELGSPSEETLIENPAAAFQKESSAPPADDTVDGDTPTENVRNLIDLGTATGNILPVAPLAAPGQVQYNVSTSGGSNGRDGRRCGGAPFGCPNLAADCCGRNGGWKCCTLVIKKDPLVTVPCNGDGTVNDKEAGRIIKKHHLEERNKKRREATAKKAARKTAAAAEAC